MATIVFDNPLVVFWEQEPMNTNTGRVVYLDQVIKRYADGPVKPIVLPLTRRQHARMKIGRNDPCPCASGKKFKRCCYTGPNR